jgi:hypothetical protein
MTRTRYRTAIDHFEDSSLGLDGGVGRLIENPALLAVALRRPVAVVHFRALVAGAIRITLASEQELDDCRGQNGKLAIGHSVFAVAEDSPVVERPGFRV